MKFSFSRQKEITQTGQTDFFTNEAGKTENEIIIPDIDMLRVKRLTMHKIKQDKKRIKIPFGSKYAKAACAILAAAMITTGSVYALNNEGLKNLITELTGVRQSDILMVGEAVSNRDYKLMVHEIVTDSYVGNVVISVEALSSKSKEAFANYRISLNHIGSGFGLRELEEYRESYTKYYEISFGGATFKNAYNNGKLQFSVEGMRKAVEVSLASTVKRIDLVLPDADSDNYRFKFDKLHLSEIGLTLEGADTRNINCEYQYNIELLFTDGTKELLRKRLNESRNDLQNDIQHNEKEANREIKHNEVGSETISQNSKAVSRETITEIDGKLIQGASERLSGDKDDYIVVSMSFLKNLPMDKIKQVIINGISYDIPK
ncbi:MAG: hypothetical protein K0R50_928 [Eubacterium sp.]|nr:hypothetical protein [Eubacterium sp.]